MFSLLGCLLWNFSIIFRCYIVKLSRIFMSKLKEALVYERTPFVSSTKAQLKREKLLFCFIVHRICWILKQKCEEYFSLHCDIFLRIFGRFFTKLFDFFSAEFSKVPFYTKRFKNNNSGLVLRRQKKIGFLELIPKYPKDIVCFET